MTTQERILSAAAELLEAKGVEGFTTRAVCDVTGVTAPTLYHHFGSKDGLIAAVVRHGVQDFMARKRKTRLTDDPIADLRRGWDSWIGFALAKPRLFRLMIEAANMDPEINAEAYAIMRRLIERVADANQLACDVDSAARVIWAASNGVLMMFLQGTGKSDIKQTADLMFEALLQRLKRTS